MSWVGTKLLDQFDKVVLRLRLDTKAHGDVWRAIASQVDRHVPDKLFEGTRDYKVIDGALYRFVKAEGGGTSGDDVRVREFQVFTDLSEEDFGWFREVSSEHPKGTACPR